MVTHERQTKFKDHPPFPSPPTPPHTHDKPPSLTSLHLGTPHPPPHSHPAPPHTNMRQADFLKLPEYFVGHLFIQQRNHKGVNCPGSFSGTGQFVHTCDTYVSRSAVWNVCVASGVSTICCGVQCSRVVLFSIWSTIKDAIVWVYGTLTELITERIIRSSDTFGRSWESCTD